MLAESDEVVRVEGPAQFLSRGESQCRVLDEALAKSGQLFLGSPFAGLLIGEDGVNSMRTARVLRMAFGSDSAP